MAQYKWQEDSGGLSRQHPARKIGETLSFTNRALKLRRVIALSWHPVQHTVTVSANGDQILDSGFHFVAQLAEWNDMMRFGESTPQLAIDVLE